jgi:hypothetical protein
VLKGSVHPLAQPQFDDGPLDPSRPIGPVILGLKRSAAQQAEIENLLEEQQDPSSPNYHKWLRRSVASSISLPTIRRWCYLERLQASPRPCSKQTWTLNGPALWRRTQPSFT